MRDFFIRGLEVMIGIILVIAALGVLGISGAVAFGGANGFVFNGTAVQGGPLAGLGILIAGAIYIIIVGGFMYLGVGIYQNTRRTAEAMEKMAANGR